MSLSSLKVKLAAVALLSVVGTSSAFAHHCTPANKPTGAGSLGTFNIATETLVANKKINEKGSNGGFITITDGASMSYDLFIHGTRPDGAMNAGPGDSECDGRGIDDFLACMGWEPE